LRLASGTKWIPLTIVALGASQLSVQVLQDKLSTFNATDDVFSPLFLHTVLFTTDDSITEIEEDVVALLVNWGCSVVYSISSPSRNFLEGPYFHNSAGLFQAWKLFPDYQEAFILATIPSQKDKYT
jgi:hypothetical protein